MNGGTEEPAAALKEPPRLADPEEVSVPTDRLEAPLWSLTVSLSHAPTHPPAPTNLTVEHGAA